MNSFFSVMPTTATLFLSLSAFRAPFPLISDEDVNLVLSPTLTPQYT